VALLGYLYGLNVWLARVAAAQQWDLLVAGLLCIAGSVALLTWLEIAQPTQRERAEDSERAPDSEWWRAHLPIHPARGRGLTGVGFAWACLMMVTSAYSHRIVF
jgi:hypothetical protein